jgi:hypothetical protein
MLCVRSQIMLYRLRAARRRVNEECEYEKEMHSHHSPIHSFSQRVAHNTQNAAGEKREVKVYISSAKCGGGVYKT